MRPNGPEARHNTRLVLGPTTSMSTRVVFVAIARPSCSTSSGSSGRVRKKSRSSDVRWWRWIAARAAPPPNATSGAMSLSTTTPRARSCQAVSSGGRPPRRDPDLDKPPDVPWDAEQWQEPLDGLGWELLELFPESAFQDRLQDRPQQLRRAIHVHCSCAAVPGPYLHTTWHVDHVSTPAVSRR